MGVAAALLAVEAVLRMFASAGAAPRPNIAADSFDAGTIVRRQIEEGVSIATFSKHGARLTGNPPAPEADVVVIIGDSYVVAEQVSDGSTMGAQVEQLARQHGIPLNVRQYGWPGASPAQYLYAAEEVRRRWNPHRVFVTVSANDFDRNALVVANPRIRAFGDSLRIIGEAIPPSVSQATRASVLAMLVRHRWAAVQTRLERRAAAKRPRVTPRHSPDVAAAEVAPDSAEYARIPALVVGALGRAYGQSLTVVYLAEVGFRGGQTPEPAEAAMLAACARLKVDCISTRVAMVAERVRGRVSHGLGIVPLGNGHLNGAGHAVVGGLMWDRLRSLSMPAPR